MPLENPTRYYNPRTKSTLILSPPLHDKAPVHPGVTAYDLADQAAQRSDRRWFWGMIVCIAATVLLTALWAGW